MRFTCWITEATNTHSEYVVFIPIAFRRQQWLREHVSMLSWYVRYLPCLIHRRFVYVKFIDVLHHHTAFSFSKSYAMMDRHVSVPHTTTKAVTYLLHAVQSFLRSWLVLQLVKKFPAFYGTLKFITVFTSARHHSLSWANSIQSPQPPHPTSWRSKQ
jgi:hypothetical protein